MRNRHEYRIVTVHEYPPIPDRSNDWCAFYDGEEERGNYGWGRTEADAISDLVVNCTDDEPDARVSLRGEVR